MHCVSMSRLTWVRVLALILICAIAGAVQYRHALAQTADDSGEAELKKGDYENAIKSFTTRLAVNGADAEAEAGMLRAYLETGRYAEAETAGKKFLIKNPNAARVRHQLAEVLAMTGRYSEAIIEFERAATDAPKSPADKLWSDLRRAEILEL